MSIGLELHPTMQEKASLSGKNVLVTGASGFLGAHLCKALLGKGARVFGLARGHDPGSYFSTQLLDKRVTSIHGDLADPRVIENLVVEKEINVVFHLGAQALVTVASELPSATYTTNIAGTVNVLEACRRHERNIDSIVISSSDKAYGQSGHLVLREADPLEARFPYDVSKACVDMISRSYFHTYGLPVCITRCANLFGGGDLHFDRLIPGVIRSALRGQAPVLRSDGNHVRDFLYVEDAVDAYLLLAENTTRAGIKGEAFNFGYEMEKRVKEVVQDILALLGREALVPTVLGVAKHEIERQVVSCEKARRLLAWRPAVGYAEGLKRTASWYTEFFEQD